jgi:hypothetical protein
VPASQDDVDAVHDLVRDASSVLDWSAGSDASLTDEETDERVPVVSRELLELYQAAVDQALEAHLNLALATLHGENPDFPLEEVLAVLERAGWTGPLRDFKLGVLERRGRGAVMEVAREGRTGGGTLGRRLFRGFLGALNAALDSLDGLPGVGVGKELKDFLERA